MKRSTAIDVILGALLAVFASVLVPARVAAPSGGVPSHSAAPPVSHQGMER